MNVNDSGIERFQPMVIRACCGLGLSVLLAACASTTVPISSPQGSTAPATSKTALRGGAGTADGSGAAGGGINEFNAAGATSDGSADDRFNIRRADGKGASADGAGADALSAEERSRMEAADANGVRAGGANGREPADRLTAGGATGSRSGGQGGSDDGTNGPGGGAGGAGGGPGSTAGRSSGKDGDLAGGPGGTGGRASGKDGDVAGGTGGNGGRSSGKDGDMAGAPGTTGGRSGGADASGKAGAGGGQGGANDPDRVALARTDGSRDGVAAIEADAAAERRGRIETGKDGVQIDRDERSVTLDGMLPTTLGMGEEQFDFDQYTLSDAVKQQLDTISGKLGTEPYDRLYITGYSDRIGDTEYNKRLSEKRAWAVAGYLMDKGVPPAKLKVEGKGETNSLVAGGECMALKRAELIQCLERDRRVELQATIKEYNLKVR